MSDTWGAILLVVLPIVGAALLRLVRPAAPTLGVTRGDVVRKAISVWGLKVGAVMAELNSYAGPEQARVQWAAIDLSKGSLDHLKRWLRYYDYREIISAADGNAEVLKRFEEQSHWKPDDEREVSFRDLSEADRK